MSDTTPDSAHAADAPAPAATPASAAPVAATAPAGWYPVAPGSMRQRWWDGSQWTEHFYEPRVAAAPVYAPQQAYAPQPTFAGQPTMPVEPPLRAAEGVKPGTVWFWLLVVGAPVLTMLDLIPTYLWLHELVGGDLLDPASLASATVSPAYLLVLLYGLFIYAFCIVFALLDWRSLRARGVPKPFHWAWSFFVLALGWPIVYVIGRTVVARRRTGRGMAPLWVFIGLEVVTFVVSLVVILSVFVQLMTAITAQLPSAGTVY